FGQAVGIGGLRFTAQDDCAQEVFLAQQQFGFPIAINVGDAKPRLGEFACAAGGINVQLLEVLARDLAQDFDLFVGHQDHQVGQAVLVSVVEGQGGGVGFEVLA